MAVVQMKDLNGIPVNLLSWIVRLGTDDTFHVSTMPKFTDAVNCGVVSKSLGNHHAEDTCAIQPRSSVASGFRYFSCTEPLVVLPGQRPGRRSSRFQNK